MPSFRFPAAWPVLLPLCLLGSAAAAPASATRLAAPRPLTPAELYAVQLASDYLAGGPASVWNALGKGSPLRDLGREEALKEIEVRLGSPDGARWELRTPPGGFPADRAIFAIEHASGLDQAVVFGVAPDESGLRLRSIRSLSEPPLRLDAESALAGAGSAASPESRTLPVLVSAVVIAGGLLAAAVLLRRRRMLSGVLAVFGLGALLVAVIGFRGLRPSPAVAAGPSPVRLLRLGSALPARRTLEAGETPSARPTSGPAATAVALWEAQLAQQRGDTERAGRLLAQCPKAVEVPWADVLRGRLAFMAKNEPESVAAYQRVIDEGLYHDGLLAEALDAFAILGYPTGREWSLEKLLGLGSRSAETYYLLARELQSYRNLGDPLEAFQAGWRIRPLDRRALFGAGRLWEYLRQPLVLSGLGIDKPDAPTGRHVAAPSARATLSAAADVRLCGSTLRVRYGGGAQLVVPGGVELAPEGTPVDGPEAEGREESLRSLSGLEALSARLRNAGALSRPALRLQLERAVLALVEHHRWAEIASLTAGYSGSVEQAPPLVVLARAEALRRTGRPELARGLLLDLEKNPVLDRLGSPGLLLDLGELLKATGDLAGAVRSVERASRVRSDPFLRQLLESLKAEQQLESAFATQVVGRFDLRFRSGAALSGPIAVGQILKSEWTRMARWFPSLNGAPVVVDLLPYVDFARTYGYDILGLYDGKIRVPVYGVSRFSPPIVSILTHELAHAMIADATFDRAPSWLHEGLAQRLEMRPERVNRIGDLVRQRTYLSIASIEEVLRSQPDRELVESAYVEAEWLVHFLERRFGRQAISRLLLAFRDGKSTEEAVLLATSLSVSELDGQFREWALNKAPGSIEDREIVRYDVEPR